MKLVELYGRVRYAVRIEGMSRREAARRFGIDPRTVAKMLAFSVPPGYRRCRDAFLGLANTCGKLGVAFWDYRGHRLRVPGSRSVPYLPHLVRCRGQPAS